MQDSYFTAGSAASHEINILGSRFIGFVEPVENEGSAESLIRQIQKAHFHATHHCYAYRIGVRVDLYSRFYDDGEPSGTAGKPILKNLERRQVTNTLCVVTRYFGGTKLGIGGLARAYSQCSLKTMDRAGRIEKFLSDSFLLQFDYRWTKTVMSLLQKFQCLTLQTQYSDQTAMVIQCRQSRTDYFKSMIIDQTAGQIRISVYKEV
jgi:uncharacterized YigZ family protein